MSDDQQNQQFLFEMLGINPQDAYQVFEKESLDYFYTELAHQGFAPKTEEEATKLAELARMLNEQEASSVKHSSESQINAAYEYLRKQAGESAESVQARRDQELQAEYQKAASDAMNPDFAAAGLIVQEHQVAVSQS